MIRNVLSIAGSDPSGGAGIQADLKAFSARGTYGMAALTALTAQNTLGVSSVHPLPAAFVAEQLCMVFADVRVDAVKIGMIANAQIAHAIAKVLQDHQSIPIVLDPVMIAKGGAPLLAPDAAAVLVEQLLPLATCLTPNLPEAAVLLGLSDAGNREDMTDQARQILKLGPKAVLMKGGHLQGGASPDVLMTDEMVHWFEATRIDTPNTHGTGCSLSSAIAAELAKGASAENAVGTAKSWLTDAVINSSELSVGSGHGPVHHFHHMWRRG